MIYMHRKFMHPYVLLIACHRFLSQSKQAGIPSLLDKLFQKVNKTSPKSTSLLLLIPSLVYIDHVLLIHSCISGYLGCFHFLATVNMAAMNMGVKMSLLDPSLNSFEYILMIYISLMVVVLTIFFMSLLNIF